MLKFRFFALRWFRGVVWFFGFEAEGAGDVECFGDAEVDCLGLVGWDEGRNGELGGEGRGRRQRKERYLVLTGVLERGQ